jgi:hypothetical protein
MPFTVGQIRFCPVENCRSGCACNGSRTPVGKNFSELFVARCGRDPAALASLRTLLPRFGIGISSHVSTAAILAVFAEHFSSGRLRLCQSPCGVTAASAADSSSAGAKPSAPAEKPFPFAHRSPNLRSTSETAADPSSFASDVNLTALAHNLEKASESGTPCIEECQYASAMA